MALNTELFMLNLPPSSIRPSDLNLLLIFILLPIARNRYKYLDSNDISKWIKIILIFYCFEFILTMILGAEDFLYGLKVIRIPLTLISFYVLRVIPFKDIKKFLTLGYIILIIQGVLYYLQFIGIHLLAGFNSTSVERYGLAFALNSPTFLYLYIFYVLADNDLSSRQKYLLFLFLIGIVLLRYVRAGIFALAISTVLYLVISKKSKETIIIGVIMALLSPIILNTLSSKESLGGKSSSGDLQNIIENIGSPTSIDPLAGSMSFRISMLIERGFYLLDNPQYSLFGVGTIHEDSPNCYKRFDFSIGTRNERKQGGKCMIESGDITWVPILLRYGFVGTLFHISLFFILFFNSYKRKDKFVFIAPLALYLLLSSFDGPLFDNADRLYFLSIVLLITYKVNSISFNLS